MKKAIKVTLLLALVAALALGMFSSAGAAQRITKTQARSIALEDAGLKRAQVTFTKSKLDRDDGVTCWEIEFYVKGQRWVEYDYEINAATGKIVDKDTDAESYKPRVIGKAAARKAALKHAGYAAGKVRFEGVELDRDDGRAHYEVEFRVRKSRKEYNYEIDAYTGKVIRWEMDYDD